MVNFNQDSITVPSHSCCITLLRIIAVEMMIVNQDHRLCGSMLRMNIQLGCQFSNNIQKH